MSSPPVVAASIAVAVVARTLNISVSSAYNLVYHHLTDVVNNGDNGGDCDGVVTPPPSPPHTSAAAPNTSAAAAVAPMCGCCLESIADTVSITCGHVYMCSTCQSKLENVLQCPICRTDTFFVRLRFTTA